MVQTKMIRTFQAVSGDAAITPDGIAVLTFVTSDPENAEIQLRRTELVRLQHRIEQELARVPQPARHP